MQRLKLDPKEKKQSLALEPFNKSIATLHNAINIIKYEIIELAKEL